uniref:Thioredoxin domain-containing protein n=1 Tax=viral metagenome TaxID=1070528 RepID=A0A6C0EUH7_9ZZZZ
MSVTKQVISKFENRNDFLKLLKLNPGLVIVKLGASWCGPCKKIAHLVDAFFASSPPDVICADIDVDDSIDLYSYLKTKRMVNGIPVILMYKRGNVSFIPDDSVTGADPVALDAFFKRCGIQLIKIQKAYANVPSLLNNIIVPK